MKKSIFIDSTSETITEILIFHKLEAIYEKLNCSIVDILNMDWTNNLFIPEQKSSMPVVSSESKFFRFKGGSPFFGNGIILATDGEGEALDTGLTISEIKVMIEFVNFFKAKEYFLRNGSYTDVFCNIPATTQVNEPNKLTDHKKQDL
jgi:hypothetical protein